jgi:hypothetical protein
MSLYPVCQPELEPFDYVLNHLSSVSLTPVDCPPPAPVDVLKHRTPDFTVNLTLEHPPDNNVIEYVAAAPPDHRASFGGSALPFASPRQAFEGSPNKGTIKINGQQLQLHIQFPNSYYTGLGSHIVPPTLYIRYRFNGQVVKASIKLSNGVPYRSLTYPALRKGVEFYDNIAVLPVRTQEGILRDSKYPVTNVEAPDFWGLKPAV